MLFVESEGWGAFYQLASAIRRRGLRAVRVSAAPRPPASTRVPLVYNWTHHVSSDQDLAGLADIVASEDVVDVQCTEQFAPTVYGQASRSFRAPETLRVERRASACDKWEVSALLGAAGIAVPATLPCAGTDPAEAVASLGLPLLLKPRLGWGGHGVHLLRTEAEVADALATCPVRDASFLERFVAGRYCQLSVLAASGTVVRGAACEIADRRYENGPASRIVTVAGDSLHDAARRVVATLGLGGLANMGVVRDESDTVWVHDVNPRVWGSFSAYEEAGVDFAGSYIDLLEGSCDPGPVWARPGVSAVVAPSDLEQALRAPTRRERVRSGASVVRAYSRKFGWRYAALMAATATTSALPRVAPGGA
ncbi:MAG: ATP-grasp domain-containing protein [Actinomycetota bacterium]|nr:ATP-grasp domain-containing protein [Actinomycetota bacterium]